MYKTGCTNWMVAFDNPKDERELRKAYVVLVKKYHSDDTHGDDKDFKIISQLYSEGVAYFKLKNGTPGVFKLLEVRDSHGHGFNFNYIYDEVVDGYWIFIAKSSICLKFIKENKVFFDNYINHLKGIKYPNEKMKDSINVCIPNIIKTFEDDTSYYIIIKKTEEVISLHDVIDYYKNTGDEWEDKYKHSVWIINRIYNLECLMEYNHIAFNGFNTRNVFISPLYHTALLLNGWQFAKEINQKMIGTTKDIYNIMPIKVKDSKLSSTMTDLESIKMIGRTLFDKGAPKEIRDFFEKASSNTAIKDWDEFEKIVTSVYGRRNFIMFNIDSIEAILKNHLK